MSANELKYLEEIINEMKEKEAEIKALEEEVEAVKLLIKEQLDQSGLTELSTANHSIKYSTCNRTNIDKKVLQAEYPDIFGKVARVSTYKMLKIS